MKKMREQKGEEVHTGDQEVKISKDEARKTWKSMKSRKAVGTDDILVEEWKCSGETAVTF